jgi:hypothetical protein
MDGQDRQDKALPSSPQNVAILVVGHWSFVVLTKPLIVPPLFGILPIRVAHGRPMLTLPGYRDE